MYRYGMAPPVVSLAGQKDYKFKFVASDLNEPAHIHVLYDNKLVAKFWIHQNTVSLKYQPHTTNEDEISKITNILLRNGNLHEIQQEWTRFFGNEDWKKTAPILKKRH